MARVIFRRRDTTATRMEIPMAQAGNETTPFTLALVRHEEKECPLEQNGPERAYLLAQKIRAIHVVGFFEQQEHQGVVIFKRIHHDTLASVLADVLPIHVTPLIIDVEVAADSAVAGQLAASRLIEPRQPRTSDCARAAHPRGAFSLSGRSRISSHYAFDLHRRRRP